MKSVFLGFYVISAILNELAVRILKKPGSGFDFTKTQLTGTVLGFLKMIKTQISLANN